MKADETELKNEGPKPIEIKNGSVRVKIYEGTKRFTKNGKFYTYPQFSLCYYDGAWRVRKRFPSLAKATKAAKDAPHQPHEPHEGFSKLFIRPEPTSEIVTASFAFPHPVTGSA